MSLRIFVLTFLSVIACMATLPVLAQGASDDILQFLPTSERYLGGRSVQSDEFAEPARGPAEIDARRNQRLQNLSEREDSEERRLREARFRADLKPKREPSALEVMYSGRIVDELSQYGYDLFGIPTAETMEKLNHLSDSRTTPSGAVQDNFVLGSGDELEIMFSGQRSDRGIYRVTPQGMVLIKDFPPIPAAGRTIGQVRLSLAAAARNLHNTEAYISLSSVRQIGVLVIGHVKKPGKKHLSVFHTVLDALMQSGGIERTGSLRQIKLVRDGRSTVIDIYGLLMHGSMNMDMNLRDGDRIIVPPIGPTVAVAGEVKRPAIYEILPGLRGMRHKPEQTSQRLSLNEMLDLGGGVLSPGKNRFLKLEITAQGEERVSDVNEAFAPGFGDGAILMVAKGEAKRAGTVELTGHTRRPGLHALSEAKTLSALLSSEDLLGPDIYPLIGAIERWDNEQFTHKILSFPLRLVLKGAYDRGLSDGDVVHLFSNEQIASLRANKVISEDDGEIGAQGSLDPEEEDKRINNATLADYLRERSAFVRGAVRKPGPYPVDEGVSLDSVLAVAGGLSLEANTRNIEITSDNLGGGSTQRETVNLAEVNPRDVMIGPGDSVRVNQKFKKIEDKSILIMGEVRNPGRYDLLPGDKLSDLLERAGSFTRQAYPEGAIFSREAERKAEEARFRAQAREIKRAIATALEMHEEKVGPAKIAEARALAEELEDVQGIGRITVEADLGKLKAQPELDILLEAGDRIFVPKRSLSVRVRGEVLSPASLQFRESKDPLDYIHEAGGFSFHADKERTFVLYPDGSAQPLQVSAWNHKATFIPPGSTIIIPRDPEPFDFVQSAKEVSQILSNLAITAIFIDDVTNGDD